MRFWTPGVCKATTGDHNSLEWQTDVAEVLCEGPYLAMANKSTDFCHAIRMNQQPRHIFDIIRHSANLSRKKNRIMKGRNMPKQRNQQQSKIGDKNSPCQRWLNKTTDAICFAIVCTTYLESQYGSVRRYKSHPKGFIHCISLHAKIDLMSLEYAGHYYGEERVN